MPTYVGMTMWKRPLRHVEHLFPGKSLTRSDRLKLPLGMRVSRERQKSSTSRRVRRANK